LRATEVRAKLEPELMELEGVVGVSHLNDQERIVVYVESPEHAGAVPRSLAGVPVEVRVAGRIVALPWLRAEPPSSPSQLKRERVHPLSIHALAASRTDRWRPLIGGISIAHPRVTAGTLGVVTLDGKILSNTHVLAPHWEGAKVGDPVLQPGPYDGGEPDDAVGRLERFVELRDGVKVDAAVASAEALALPMAVLEAPPVVGWVEPAAGMPVSKSGRTCGVSSGRVVDVEATIRVAYPHGDVTLREQVVVEPAIGLPGDSGSLVTSGGAAVGLLFAGSDLVTVANRVDNVVEALGVNLGLRLPRWEPPNALGLVGGLAAPALCLGVVAAGESKRYVF